MDSVLVPPLAGSGSQGLANRIRADVAPLAEGAVVTEIEGVNPVGQPVEVFGIIGEQTGFKVASVRVFGTEAGTGQVGRSEKGDFAVDDDGLGVDARAEDSLEEIGFNEVGIFVEVLSEAWPGFLGVDQANGDAVADEIGEDLKKGDVAATFPDVHVLDVSRDDPEVFFSMWKKFDENALVNFFVEEDFVHGAAGGALLGQMRINRSQRQ